MKQEREVERKSIFYVESKEVLPQFQVTPTLGSLPFSSVWKTHVFLILRNSTNKNLDKEAENVFRKIAIIEKHFLNYQRLSMQDFPE